VEHGTARGMSGGTTVCVEADIHPVPCDVQHPEVNDFSRTTSTRRSSRPSADGALGDVDQYIYSSPCGDAELHEEPRHSEYQRGRRADGVHRRSNVDQEEEPSSDDDDATLPDADVDFKEQRSALATAYAEGGRKHSQGYGPPVSSTPGIGQRFDDITEEDVIGLMNSIQQSPEDHDDEEIQLVLRVARNIEERRRSSPEHQPVALPSEAAAAGETSPQHGSPTNPTLAPKVGPTNPTVPTEEKEFWGKEYRKR